MIRKKGVYLWCVALVQLDDLTLRSPRINYERFRDILARKPSPALSEAKPIWDLLIAGGVDPSFALGQFLVESIYGTAGHAKVTKSWGNILWDAAWTPTRDKYAPGNGYTYAKYPNWTEGAEDYVAYVRRYAETVDNRYGGVTDTIDECTARWVGDPLDSEEHKRYVSVLLSAINDDYEHVPNSFVDVGDRMIYAGKAGITSKARYPLKNGTAAYRGTDGTLLKYVSFGDGSSTLVTDVRFLGPVGQPWTDTTWAWGAFVFGTSAADPQGTIAYIKNPDPKKVKFV